MLTRDLNNLGSTTSDSRCERVKSSDSSDGSTTSTFGAAIDPSVYQLEGRDKCELPSIERSITNSSNVADRSAFFHGRRLKGKHKHEWLSTWTVTTKALTKAKTAREISWGFPGYSS